MTYDRIKRKILHHRYGWEEHAPVKDRIAAKLRGDIPPITLPVDEYYEVLIGGSDDKGRPFAGALVDKGRVMLFGVEVLCQKTDASESSTS